MSFDGKDIGLGAKMRMCISAATDAAMSGFGQQMGRRICARQVVTKDLGGSVRFSSTCAVGRGGTTTSTGVARGDFSSGYVIHMESDTTGAAYAAMNGHHVTELHATYAGPCPPDMTPGDVDAGNGVKVNIDRMAQGGAPAVP